MIAAEGGVEGAGTTRVCKRGPVPGAAAARSSQQKRHPLLTSSSLEQRLRRLSFLVV